MIIIWSLKKQLLIEKSEKINIFDISIYRKVKYRNINIEKIPVFIDILIYRNSLTDNDTTDVCALDVIYHYIAMESDLCVHNETV